MATSQILRPANAASTKLKALLVACLTMLAGAALALALAPAHAWAASSFGGITEPTVKHSQGFDPLDLLPQDELATADEIGTTSLNETFNALRQDLAIYGIGYAATGADYNELAGLTGTEGALPDGRHNVFWIGNDNNLSTETCYCLLIQTNIGTYFVAPSVPITENNWFGASFIVDGFSTALCTYYCPTTLGQYLDASNEEIPSLYSDWTLVTEENEDSIPFPNAEGATSDEPLTMVLNLLIYPEPSYPAGLVPTFENLAANLYDPLIIAPFEVSSPQYAANKQMQAGRMSALGENIASGDSAVWLRLSSIKDWLHVAALYADVEGAPNYTCWLLPKDEELCLILYNDLGQYIATEAAFADWPNHDTITEITDTQIYRNQSEFYFDVPDYDYELAITDVVAYPGEYGYLDVPADAWYRQSVADATRLGFVHGYAPGDLYFGPADNVTRAQIATILFNMSGWTEETYSVSAELGGAAPTFPDVPEGASYYEPVEWAAANGVVTGHTTASGAYFAPEDDATREQVMTMAYRYARLLEGDDFTPLTPSDAEAELAKFPDGGSVSGWARDAVAWCVANGVVTGKSTASGYVLAPQNPTTRAEAATIAVRLQPYSLSEPIGK